MFILDLIFYIFLIFNILPYESCLRTIKYFYLFKKKTKLKFWIFYFGDAKLSDNALRHMLNCPKKKKKNEGDSPNKLD